MSTEQKESTEQEVSTEQEESTEQEVSTASPFCEYKHDGVVILKYYFVTDVLPDEDKNIFIGPSTTDSMTITLDKPMKIGNTPLNKQHPMWETTFEVEVNELELTVRKSDDCVSENNTGWKQYLVLPIL